MKKVHYFPQKKKLKKEKGRGQKVEGKGTGRSVEGTSPLELLRANSGGETGGHSRLSSLKKSIPFDNVQILLTNVRQGIKRKLLKKMLFNVTIH